MHVARAMEPSLEQFADLHRAQLHAIGFPLPLVSRLFSRLSAKQKENLDRYFEVCPDKNETLSACGSVLKCRRSMQALSDVFVLQHWWECDGGQEAREKLMSDPELLERVEGVLGIRGKSGRERKGAEEVRREMVRVVCEQSGKSEAVALKALANSGHDVIAAIISAETLTDKDVSANTEQSSNPTLSLEEFQKGLSAVSGEPADDIPESLLQGLYDDYIHRASHISVARDEEGWVHCGGYSWKDGGEEGVVSVSVPLPSGTGKRKIVSKISALRWKFGLVGELLMIDGEFSHRVVPDECFWTLDGGCVSVSVQKGEVEREWGRLLVGEVQLGKEEVERVQKVRKEWVASRVEDVMKKMWFVNQTYQAVTAGGNMKLKCLLSVFPLSHFLSSCSTCTPPQASRGQCGTCWNLSDWLWSTVESRTLPAILSPMLSLAVWSLSCGLWKMWGRETCAAETTSQCCIPGRQRRAGQLGRQPYWGSTVNT